MDSTVVPDNESFFYWPLFHTIAIIYIGALIALATDYIWARGREEVSIGLKHRIIKRKRHKTQAYIHQFLLYETTGYEIIIQEEFRVKVDNLHTRHPLIGLKIGA